MPARRPVQWSKRSTCISEARAVARADLEPVDDELDGPTAAAFGRRGTDRMNLYITNAAFPFFTISNTPSIIKTTIGIPGNPN